MVFYYVIFTEFFACHLIKKNIDEFIEDSDSSGTEKVETDSEDDTPSPSKLLKSNFNVSEFLKNYP